MTFASITVMFSIGLFISLLPVVNFIALASRRKRRVNTNHESLYENLLNHGVDPLVAFDAVTQFSSQANVRN